MNDVPIAGQLARFAAELRHDHIPAAVLDRACLHILDCLGIAIAASGEDFALRTLAAIRGLAGPGPVPVIAMPARLPLRDAVLVNGTLIHGLDFDDTHTGGVIHASVSAVATVLGAGLVHAASGRQAITAYLIGVETSSRLGAAANGGFHQVGFHPTGLVGAFGCTLAAGRLGGLDASALATAQGIVLSMAAGSLEFLADGAWTKRMHPGWAGVCGITAAELARHGFEGPRLPYEGRFGLYRAYLGAEARVDLAKCTAGLGETWEMLNVAVKPYPACHFNHAFADATLALVRAHGITADKVATITARIGEGQVKTVCEPEARKRRPANSYEAQFSVHYTIASALVRGRFTLSDISESAIRDPEVLALAERVSYEVDPRSAFPRYYSGEVEIETRDGRRFVHREQENRGSDRRPLTEAEIVAKFHDNAARAWNRSRADGVVDLVLSLDRAPRLDDLMEALAA